MNEKNENNYTPDNDSSETMKVESRDFSCPECGAPIEFEPEKNSLSCNYCGFHQVINGEASNEEFQLLDESDDINDWASETKIIRCKQCGAENVVSNKAISDSCPFCGSNQVVDTDGLVGIKPHRVIPFKITKEQAQGFYIKSVRKNFFTPNKIKNNQINVTVLGTYLPVWTFDTNTLSSYTGRLGKYYTVVVGSGKNRRTETRIRWFSIKGVRQVSFDDLLVNAGKNISQVEITKISPYNTNDSFIYNQQYLAGFSAEHYALTVKEGWEKAKVLARPTIERNILSQYNYDIVGNMDIKTNYNDMTYKYVLVPTWVGNYDYNSKHYRFLVNGESGKMMGKSPKSALKITIVIALVIAVIAIIVVLIMVFGPVEY